MSTTVDPTTNGHDPAPPRAAPPASGALAALRVRPVNLHLFRGYGPLVVGAVLFVLMVLLAPTVAPERVVEQPVDDVSSVTAP